MNKRRLWLIAAVVLVAVAALQLAACGSSTTSTTAGPATTAGGVTTATGATVDAAALYAQDCGLSGCHSSVPSADLATATEVISSGKGGGMPAFKDKLTADQITALATWVANGGK